MTDHSTEFDGHEVSAVLAAALLGLDDGATLQLLVQGDRGRPPRAVERAAYLVDTNTLLLLTDPRPVTTFSLDARVDDSWLERRIREDLYRGAYRRRDALRDLDLADRRDGGRP